MSENLNQNDAENDKQELVEVKNGQAGKNERLLRIIQRKDEKLEKLRHIFFDYRQVIEGAILTLGYSENPIEEATEALTSARDRIDRWADELKLSSNFMLPLTDSECEEDFS